MKTFTAANIIDGKEKLADYKLVDKAFKPQSHAHQKKQKRRDEEEAVYGTLVFSLFLGRHDEGLFCLLYARLL